MIKIIKSLFTIRMIRDLHGKSSYWRAVGAIELQRRESKPVSSAPFKLHGIVDIFHDKHVIGQENGMSLPAFIKCRIHVKKIDGHYAYAHFNNKLSSPSR